MAKTAAVPDILAEIAATRPLGRQCLIDKAPREVKNDCAKVAEAITTGVLDATVTHAWRVLKKKHGDRVPSEPAFRKFVSEWSERPRA